MSPDPSLDPDRTGPLAPAPAAGQPETVDVTGDRTGDHNPDDAPTAPASAPTIPGYEIHSLIARGGMGAVFAGRDLTLDREVAVKTLLPGADPDRFVTEAKITARLPHPGIPPVHALGTLPDGGHFLVMKLVRGDTLARLLKDRPSPADNLPRFVQVFEQIAQAVGFAHSRGVLHRDLKPLNVMVGEFGEVQVMDWGLAKDQANPGRESGSDRAAPDTPELTHAGAVMGTPGYMAPEQARGEVVDARADVFALGSVLAAVLTGRPAFVGTTARETIGKAAAADLADVLVRLDACGADAELVALARRCLGAHAPDRPADARAVAAEVAGYRAGVEARWRQAETDRARAETQAAEQRKRRRVVQWAGGLLAAVLLAGVVGTTIGFVRADQQRAEAEEAGERERERADGETREKEEKERQRGIADNRRVAAERAQKQEALARVAAERAETEKADILDVMVTAVTGESLATQKAITAEQKEFLTQVLPHYRKFASARGDDLKTRLRIARAAFSLGMIESRLGRRAEGAAAFESARDSYAKLTTEFPAVPEYRHYLAGSHYGLGALLDGLGKSAAAEEQYRKALMIEEQLAAEFPAAPEHRQYVAGGHIGLGSLLAGLGQGAAAEEQYRKGLAIQEQLAADFTANSDYRAYLAGSHNGLGYLLAGHGQKAAAEEQYRKALIIQEKLAAEFPAYRASLAANHTNLGGLLAGLGQGAAAEEQYRKALTIEEQLAAEFPAVPYHRRNLAAGHYGLGVLLAGLGQGAAAEEQYRKGLAILEKLTAEFPAVPDYRANLAGSHTGLGVLLKGLGQGVAAEEQYRKALTIEAKLAAEFPAVPAYRRDLAGSHANLGVLLADLGQRAAAAEQYRKALTIQEQLAAEFPAVPDYRRNLAKSHNSLGSLLADLGQRAAAEEQYRKALTIQEQLAAEFPANSDYRQDQARSHNSLGRLFADLGQGATAEEQHRKGLAIQEKMVADYPAIPDYRQDLARSHNSLGLLLAGLGQGAAAKEHYLKGLAIREKLAADFPAMPVYQVELGGSYSNFGRLIRDGGDPAESLKWYGRAIDCLQPVHEKEPRDVTAKQFLRNSHFGRAKAHDQLQKFPETVKDWDRAIVLSPPAEQPSFRASRATSRLHAGMVAEAVAEVAELTKSPNWNAGRWYDFACVYSVASGKLAAKKREYADRAMELLPLAVKAGYKDAAHMKKDTDFDPLRDRADFKTLLADLEKKFPPPLPVAPPPREKN